MKIVFVKVQFEFEWRLDQTHTLLVILGRVSNKNCKNSYEIIWQQPNFLSKPSYIWGINQVILSRVQKI